MTFAGAFHALILDKIYRYLTINLGYQDRQGEEGMRKGLAEIYRERDGKVPLSEPKARILMRL